MRQKQIRDVDRAKLEAEYQGYRQEQISKMFLLRWRSYQFFVNCSSWQENMEPAYTYRCISIWFGTCLINSLQDSCGNVSDLPMASMWLCVSNHYKTFKWKYWLALTCWFKIDQDMNNNYVKPFLRYIFRNSDFVLIKLR